MGRYSTAVLYVAAMLATIVGVDVVFLRQHFWLRLAANIIIAAVAAAVYLRFLKPS